MWLSGVLGCLEQDPSLPQADGQAEESRRLAEAVNGDLEMIFFVCYESAVICEESFKDEVSLLSWFLLSDRRLCSNREPSGLYLM